jgi:asparagine synthase (glutamine-hydrolysing)
MRRRGSLPGRKPWRLRAAWTLPRAHPHVRGPGLTGMCGVAGLLTVDSAGRPAGIGAEPDAHKATDSTAARRAALSAMIARLDHRGPDGSALFTEGPCGLAHARLAIIDLDHGAQPIASEDGAVTVVCNGEIFNEPALRAELVRRGHRFRTGSDVEAIVHLYEDHGDDFVEHLNGQFAIALWDARRRRLVLARDRVGIRPLFHARIGETFAFASEAKALFALPGLERRLDPAALASVFGYWSVLPPASVFAGVSTVPPGCVLTIDGRGVRTRRYWDWSFPDAAAGPATAPEFASEDACAEALRALLDDAVRLQLRADVRVGAYLSGGLDSSIVSALACGHAAAPLHTFSIGFDDAAFDEGGPQREMAAFLGSRIAHRTLPCSQADIAASFAQAVWHAETPLVRTAPVPLMRLAARARADGCKVVLTGEGADEVFGGYDLFKEARLRRMLARWPQSERRARLLERLYPYLEHSPSASPALARRFFMQEAGLGGDAGTQADLAQLLAAPGFAHQPRLRTSRRAIGFFGPAWRDTMAGWDPQAALAAHLPAAFGGWAPLARDQYVEASTLLSGYLLAAQGDRMAMAASVEARVPFLDHRVIEFANRMPARYKLRGLRDKVLLRRALRRELPPAIARRPKQPYRAPDAACFVRDGRPLDWVAELLSPARLEDAGLLDPAATNRLLAKVAAGRAIGFGDNIAFVGLLSTALLHEQFVRGDGGRPA